MESDREWVAQVRKLVCRHRGCPHAWRRRPACRWHCSVRWSVNCLERYGYRPGNHGVCCCFRCHEDYPEEEEEALAKGGNEEEDEEYGEGEDVPDSSTGPGSSTFGTRQAMWHGGAHNFGEEVAGAAAAGRAPGREAAVPPGDGGPGAAARVAVWLGTPCSTFSRAKEVGKGGLFKNLVNSRELRAALRKKS